MKKRIISIALVVVMIVAMVPATLLTAVAGPYTGRTDGYDVYFSETDLTLDGNMDAAYENSEKIVRGHFHTYKGSAPETDMVAYAVATNSGFYVYVDVTDATVDKDVEADNGQGKGDKAQVYMQVANKVGDTTMYQELHYDFDYAHTASAQNALCTSASTITADGYTIEMFIPWSVWTGITNGLSVATATVYFGIQVNNYDMTETVHKIMIADCGFTNGYWEGPYKPTEGGTVKPAKMMTKANVITAPKAAASDLYYTANVVDYADITFDGKMDEAYNFSGKISANYAHKGTIGVDSDFDTYMLVTEKGIYVFASILDDSFDKKESEDVRDGDKFQLSLTLGNTYWTRTGYIDFDYLNGGRQYVTGNYGGTGIEQKVTFWDNNKGWNIEIFIPYTFCDDTKDGGVGYSSGVLSQNDLVMRANIQVNNHTILTTNAETGRATSVDNHGQVYDIKEATASYNTPSVKVPVKLARHEGFGNVVYASSITRDGVKDDAYGGDENAFYLVHSISKQGICDHAPNLSGKVWAAITDTRIYFYGEFTDPDNNANANQDGLIANVSFPISGGNIRFGGGYHHDGHWITSHTWGGDRDTFWYTQSPSDDRRGGVKVNHLGDNKYAVEFDIEIPHAEQTLLAMGETFPIALSFEYQDCCTASVVSEDVPGKNSFGICAIYRSSTFWGYWNSKSAYRVNMPRWTVDKDINAANTGVVSKISSANVVLGESINIKYNVNLPITALNAVMKFTFNDKVTYVPVTRTGNTTGEVLFEDIAPQCMGDNIKAELYVDGVKADSVDEYSVKQNVTNIKNTDNEALVDALLLYGAAAQQYTDYKTDALVADLSDLDVSTIWGIESAKEVGAPADEAKFVAAGVRFANFNKLYVKVDNVENVASLTVKVGDAEPVALELNSNGVAYTDAIKATEFGTVYTFELTDTNGVSQTLDYSVNSYVYAKTTNTGDVDSNIAVLSIALYNYGVAAEAYIAD